MRVPTSALVEDLPLVEAAVRADFEKSSPDAAQGRADPIEIVEGMATGPPALNTPLAGALLEPLGAAALLGLEPLRGARTRTLA